MVIVYRGKWRWIPVHNVYWSNGNFCTAACIMTIIDSRTDKITQRVSVQSSHQYTPNDTRNSLRSSVNPPFRFTWIINCIQISFSLSVMYWVIQFPFFSISSSIHSIKFFLSFLFRRLSFWLTSLTFVILFARKVIAMSHRLLCVSSVCSWTKPHGFSLFKCPL
jgi:hypothetical protein